MPRKNLNLKVSNIVEKNTTVVYFCERVYLTSLTDRRDNFYDTAALKSTVLISVVNYCICKPHRNSALGYKVEGE